MIPGDDGTVVRPGASCRDRVASENGDPYAALQIPHEERVVIGFRHRATSVPRHRHAPDRTQVPLSVRSNFPVARSHTLSVRSSDGDTARRPSPVTATPLTQSACPSSVPLQLPAGQIPHLQSPVIRRRHSAPPIPRHRHASDPGRVPLRCALQIPSHNIPHPQRPVIRRRHSKPAVPRHRQVHHSDPGNQYACTEYACESFLKTLKQEAIYCNQYRDFEELSAHLEEFIDQYYNRLRLHSALGYRTPEELEQAAAAVPASGDIQAAATMSFFEPPERKASPGSGASPVRNWGDRIFRRGSPRHSAVP